MTINYEIHAPYAGRRLVIGILFIAVLVLGLLSWGGGADPIVPRSPGAPRVTPGALSLTVSWSPPAGSATPSRYEVATTPRSITCALVAATICRVSSVDDATPWSFSVRALVDGIWTPWSPRSAPVPHVTIAIVAGQSNATGWESTAVDPTTGKNLLSASSSPADSVTSIAWDQPNTIKDQRVGVDGSGPVPLLTAQILDSPSQAGPEGQQIFGPEVELARGLYAAGVRDVVILKVTQSGTALGNNGPWAPPSGVLFTRLVNDTHDLEVWEAEHGALATVADISWYQGESDATPGLAPSYEQNLTTFITTLRSDLATNPATPFIIVKPSIAAYVAFEKRTGSCISAACAAQLAADAQVRAADDAVAASLPHVFLVDSVLLPRSSMGLHLDGQGELLLGKELAAVGLKAGLT